MKNRDRLSDQGTYANTGIGELMEAMGIEAVPPEGSRTLEAWLLGPRGENADVLEQLISEAIRDQMFWRRNFHPEDPAHITEQMKASEGYIASMGKLKDDYRDLLAFLKKSVPFFSMRYQGHMNWDVTLPSILGYFAAMLYNPNNVAFEGSAATTLLELVVGDDLCRMLGYEISADEGAIRPWGHITCDGTVANIEALWAARNLKLYALALREALACDARLEKARDLTVPQTGGGQARLLDLDLWSLLNLQGDDVLALSDRLKETYGIDPDLTNAALKPFTVQQLGLADFGRRFLKDSPSPVVLVTGSKHYSHPKAVALLGIGNACMIDVDTDADARMDLGDLEEKLEECLAKKQPVYAVIVVIGSTEESAIDPLTGVLALRESFRARGLDFLIHADAAWGGYHRSVINEDFEMPRPGAPMAAAAGPVPALPLSDYAAKQLTALGRADSITVDPHKSGYIPYAAGALCYRNGQTRNLLTFTAPVITGGGPEPTVGIYGVEGSKPGAAVASVYLSHRVIRPTRSGYGKLIGQALFNCKMLYARLLTLHKRLDFSRYQCFPVPRLPAERVGGDVEAQLRFIQDRIVGRSNDALAADPEAMALLAEIGPDQNIFAYRFNFMWKGVLNPDLAKANEFNRKVYQRISIKPGQEIYGYKLIVSNGEIGPSYGPGLVEDLKRRMGVGDSAGDTVQILRSVVMDPWLTETARGSFLDTLEAEFIAALEDATDETFAALDATAD